MRTEPDRLHDVADGAGLHQLARPDGRAVFEPLAVHDRVDAAGLRLHAAHLGQLLERRDARLVGHVVLAVLHHADADRRAVGRNRRAQHQLDARVLENLVLAARHLDAGEPLLKILHQVRLFGVDPHQLAAAALHGADLAVDVIVVDADDGESDPLIGTLRAKSRRQRRRQRGRARHRLHERPPIDAWPRHVWLQVSPAGERSRAGPAVHEVIHGGVGAVQVMQPDTGRF